MDGSHGPVIWRGSNGGGLPWTDPLKGSSSGVLCRDSPGGGPLEEFHWIESYGGVPKERSLEGAPLQCLPLGFAEESPLNWVH
jgi:hypothetical protein